MYSLLTMEVTPFGAKITINTRNTPMPRYVNGGPTLLTLGKKEPKLLSRKVVTEGKEKDVSIETRIAAPIIGPSIVPNPPMTAIIRGVNELTGRKIELSTKRKAGL